MGRTVIETREIIEELSYKGNLGIHELMMFYDVATSFQIKSLEKLLASKKSKQALAFIEKILGYQLNTEEEMRLTNLIPEEEGSI